MKIGILASGGLGLTVLKECREFLSPVFIATDKKSNAIIEYARENLIPLFIGNPREGELKNFLDNQDKLSVIFSINYLYLIENDIISRVDYIINFHGSLLPKYRGRTPHVWAIINNETLTGITAHLIDENCDTGAILLQKKIEIKTEDTGGDLLIKFEKSYPEMISEILLRHENGNLDNYKIDQDNSKATYFGKRTFTDGQIDWNWEKERIYNWIRAQAAPYPGAFTYLNGKKIIIDKIAFSDLGFNYDMPNGLILDDKNRIVVKTPNGTVELIAVRENRKLCKKDKIFKYED